MPRDASLGWTPGNFAPPINGHRVYFGESFNDVNDATGGVAQDANSYAPPQRLDFGTNYYWRVDEVNSAPDFTVFTGDIWNFTTEPFSIPIAGITATASSSFGDSGPEKTIDGSGLVDDLHGTSAGDMWISAGVPATLEYAFDRAYKLHELWIWNSNQLIEGFVGFGAKDVVIEHSLDGENWTVLAGVGPLARAPGTEGYAHNNTIDFGGALAQHVRVAVNSVQGIAPQASLSEVRFYYIPVSARDPQPANGATIDGVDAALSWRSGREAGRHEVYLDMETATTLVATVDENSYLATALELESTYHWKIHEVNDAESPAVHEGDTWSFSTPASLSVDDMESYKDAEFLEIWATWVDGFDDPANGSLVGGASGTPETGIVHAGSQSLPIWFDNSTAPVSEATRTFDQTQDWTRSGIQTLVLYLNRGADNTGGGVYVKINDTKMVYEAAAGLPPGWDVWTQWTIDLSAVAADLTRVRSLTIGVEGAGARG
ncbi:MAG: discoidin domain-containing protein, partial [Planctomycetes bacterium]|nr:discoidin domain-containing protein [Planctomycetota bacterium]